MGEMKGMKMRAVWSILERRLEGKYKIGTAGGGDYFLKYLYTSDVLTKEQMGEKKGKKMRAVQKLSTRLAS